MKLFDKIFSRNNKSTNITEEQMKELINLNQDLFNITQELKTELSDAKKVVDTIYQRQDEGIKYERELNKRTTTTIFRFILQFLLVLIVPISAYASFTEFYYSMDMNEVSIIRIIYLIAEIGILIIGVVGLFKVLSNLILGFGDSIKLLFVHGNMDKKTRHKKAEHFVIKKIFLLVEVLVYLHFVLILVIAVYLLVSKGADRNGLLIHWECGMVGYIIAIASLDISDMVRKANHTILFNGITLVVAIGSLLFNDIVRETVLGYLSFLFV